MADNLTLARSIRAAAYAQMQVLAQDHQDHPWADSEAHAAYAAKRFAPGKVAFVAFPDRVTILHIADAGYPAIDALDHAAQLDNSDGRIETVDNRMAVYWLAN